MRTVPAMIAIDPNETTLRGWRTALDDGGRRADANHNLRKGSSRNQTKGKQNGHGNFFQGNCVLHGLSAAGNVLSSGLVDINSQREE
jgi:hypothetical protein